MHATTTFCAQHAAGNLTEKAYALTKMGGIEGNIQHKLLHFVGLGPTPVQLPYTPHITPTPPVDAGREALHGLITELERIVNEWEIMNILII